MAKISFIIPIQKEEDLLENKVGKTITSIKEMYGAKECELIVPYFKFSDDAEALIRARIEEFNNGYLSEITYVEGDKNNFCSLADKAIVSVCSTKYFTIASVNDTFSKFSLSNLEKYSENNECSAYLFIGQVRDEENDKPFVGFSNEISWSMGYADEPGFLDNGSLRAYADFEVLCGFVNTNDYISVGRLNPDYGLVSWYEFLLRFVSKGKKVFVIPKIGFSHDGGHMEDWAMRFTDDKDYPKKVSGLIEKALSENNTEG